MLEGLDKEDSVQQCVPKKEEEKEILSLQQRFVTTSVLQSQLEKVEGVQVSS